MKTLRTIFVLGLTAAALVVGLAAHGTRAADHLDAPLIQADGRVDINDLYAFQSPANSNNVVMIMTVNPVAGILSPETFKPHSAYEFMIDESGRGKTTAQYEVRFGRPNANGEQRVRLRRRDIGAGGFRTLATGFTGQDISVHGGGTLRAHIFDDPFFFDLVAFQDQVLGAGGSRTFCDGNETDFFAGLNVSAIVLEVPRAAFESDNIGVWARTRAGGPQQDRIGRPAINTVLIPSGAKDDFNHTNPVRDVANWSDEVKSSLLFLSGLDGSGYTGAEADAITALLLPDILTIDTSNPAGFTDGPLNGRLLPDDVIDFELFVVTGGLGANGSPVLTSDCVDANDVPFLTQFPYLAPPH
ncbi:MAG: DUF4331 family protein [Anaerolineae bacterium]